jgi:2-dehydro-3-deoxyphosphogluconate aldolase/(4S)-4-hydroxy-2-oxoglutarate aldolase
MAVGGVNLDNLEEFFKAGAMGAGIGGNLANKKLISDGNFAAITDLAKHFVKLAK